jgi:hypothetical protein
MRLGHAAGQQQAQEQDDQTRQPGSSGSTLAYETQDFIVLCPDLIRASRVAGRPWIAGSSPAMTQALNHQVLASRFL